MMILLVNKITREIYMGEGDRKLLDDEIVLNDVFQVNFMEVERGKFIPVPTDYLPFSESLFTENALKRFDKISFIIKNFHVFTESEIRKEMLDWHTRAMAQKSGIEIVGAGSQIIQ